MREYDHYEVGDLEIEGFGKQHILKRWRTNNEQGQ